jgi:hypothetical protein
MCRPVHLGRTGGTLLSRKVSRSRTVNKRLVGKGQSETPKQCYRERNKMCAANSKHKTALEMDYKRAGQVPSPYRESKPELLHSFDIIFSYFVLSPLPVVISRPRP